MTAGFSQGTVPAERLLEENLRFIAEALGANRNEEPRGTLRRYLAAGFFKDHLKSYKKRPIYWLFSSGKQRAFQCLVYLHRYHEGTLARMRTEYVIPLQGKLAARIRQLEDDKPAATSTSHRRKLEKEQDALKKQQTELVAFDEKLRHAELIAGMIPGEEVLITQHEQPIAKLVAQPQPARKPRQPGSAKGKLIILAEDDEHLADFKP